jgi:DNA helicase-2/ATP-dependent DNA helicase PcrA
MRFPSLSDLDREQRKIYGEAPGDGAIIVVGPPGTGKTVMAFHRAQKQKALGQKPQVIMFNRVLRRYTSTRSNVAADVPVKTMNQWAYNWWKRAAKQAVLPSLNGNSYDIDWTTICSEALPKLANQNGQNAFDWGGQNPFDWGHLLIDEGQDFPPTMYMALGIIQNQLANQGVNTQITVFADDNQRLQVDKNSRISEIRDHLFIKGISSRNFTLRKNFRNTRPIANFAAHFQVGNESGVAELPDKEGEIPQVVFANNDREVADFISRKAKLNPGKQIGVIVYGTSRLVKHTYNQLKSRIGGSGSGLRIQAYMSGDKTHTDESLDFDSGNTVTVLHAQSAKGLEFDLVFFVGMERMSLDSSGFHNERMALYVMSSRARSELYIVFTEIDPRAELPASTVLLPRPSTKICRYVGLGELEALVPSIEDKIEKCLGDNDLEVE